MRACRTSKVPESIALQIKSGERKAQDYYSVWLNSDKDWGKVVMFERTSQTEGTENKTRRVWATEAVIRHKLKSSV
eukprot:1489871-Alexandrium_andersonii.AAC.1